MAMFTHTQPLVLVCPNYIKCPIIQINHFPQDRAWIKNRRVNAGSNCVGVNIDRNYDCHWGEDGSSTDPCSNVFAGTGPDSEPEAEAISRQVRNYGNRLIVSVSLQSFGSRILYPMAHSR